MHALASTLLMAHAQPVARSITSSTKHSLAHRRLAKDLVWRWARARWPSLLPSATLMERSHIENSLPGRALTVNMSDDGAVWTLSIANQERDSAPIWLTRASITDTGTADQFSVETACSDIGAAAVVSPPAVLGTWVDRLELEDGVIPVLGVPRMIEGEAQAMSLLEQIATPERRLPFLVLAAKGTSRYYGSDPRVLAQNLRGIAHVACLSTPALRVCASRLGRTLAPAAGAVRIYAAGAPPQADAACAHPIFYPPSVDAAADVVPAPTRAFRSKLVRAVCELSVAARSACMT